MLESISLSEQRAKIQKELRSERFAFLTGAEEDFATRQGEIRAKYDQIDDLEIRIIAAHTKESDEAQAVMDRHADTSGWTPELRELHKTAQKTSIADYVQAAVEERSVTGAARNTAITSSAITRLGTTRWKCCSTATRTSTSSPPRWKHSRPKTGR